MSIFDVYLDTFIESFDKSQNELEAKFYLELIIETLEQKIQMDAKYNEEIELLHKEYLKEYERLYF